MADQESKSVPVGDVHSRFREWLARVHASWVFGMLVVIGMAATAVYFGPRLLGRLRPVEPDTNESPVSGVRAAELVLGHADRLQISDQVATSLPVKVTAVQPATESVELRFSGTLTLDPSRYVTVRSRFAGEVVQVCDRSGTLVPIALGDTVEQDELLAIVWSRELGEKKSELVDAWQQWSLDKGTYERLAELYKKGDLPERSLRDAQRAVQADKIAVDRITRTLQAWREPEATIQALRNEAEQHPAAGEHSDVGLVHQWARVELKSPLSGVVLERNITVGEMIQTTDELFKIADMSQLRVVANVYEEDLPRLDAIPPGQRQWRITVPAEPQAPAREGVFEQIGHIVDPAQHTALVMGWVQNPAGRLRVGQFVAATVHLPCDADEVVIPSAALLESGAEKYVFVQTDESGRVYQLRRIHLARRLDEQVTVHSQPAAESGMLPLAVGERVVTSGAVEMLGVLRELQAAAK